MQSQHSKFTEYVSEELSKINTTLESFTVVEEMKETIERVAELNQKIHEKLDNTVHEETIANLQQVIQVSAFVFFSHTR